MNQHQLLKEEDTSPNLNSIEIIFRNPSNDDIKIKLDLSKVKQVNQMRQVLLSTLKNCDDKEIKLFFKGKPLKDNDLVSQFNITNQDVILYMIMDRVEEGKTNNEISSLTENLDNDEQSEGNILHRGFSRFAALGMNPREIHMLRILFHTTILAQSGQDSENVDWTPNGILQREEEWLDSHERRIRANPETAIALYIGRNYNTSRILNQSPQFSDENYEEHNSRFFIGLFCGFFLNLFSIIFLFLCNFKPKFKIGLQIGMVLGFISFVLNQVDSNINRHRF